MVEISNSFRAHARHDAPNILWKVEYDDFLIPLPVMQINNGLKCDKTFKKPVFVYVANTVNARS